MRRGAWVGGVASCPAAAASLRQRRGLSEAAVGAQAEMPRSLRDAAARPGTSPRGSSAMTPAGSAATAVLA
jgi:hypothetical protein